MWHCGKKETTKVSQSMAQSLAKYYDIGKFSHFFHESLAFLLWIPLYLMSVLIFYEQTQANPSFQKKDGNLESNST